MSIATWKGDFGIAYTERNAIDWRDVYPVFRKMVGGLDIDSVLEIGCNRGHNLRALRELLGCLVVGIEPNEQARSCANELGIHTIDGNARYLDFVDGKFDLVLTAGLLIHVPRDCNLLRYAISEMIRVSRKYILLIEYFSPKDERKTYRDDVPLWTRHWPQEVWKVEPGLRLTKSWWDLRWPFEGCSAWLFQKL